MKQNLLKTALIIIILSFSGRVFSQNCVGPGGQVQWSYWMGFTSFPDSSDLAILETFPSRPDGFQMLGKLQTPPNFSDYFTSMIRGYISVPTTGNYYFNITGDDDSRFFLSTNDSPANLKKKAWVYSYTGIAEHYKDSTQTSVLTTLVGGQNYYFEMYNSEGGGGDHMTLYWRKPNTPDLDTNWLVVDYNYIKSYTCTQNCPPRGTSCNDNNPLTSNDQQDGFCNCVGDYTSNNYCVGERGKVEAYYFDNIPGNYVEYDLLNSPKFPLMPDRKEYLKGASGPLEPYTRDEYGTLLQGYITVPVTGLYEFVITGDNQTFFYMSKNDSIEYKQYHQALVFYGIGETDINSTSFQYISPLTLEKGKYYYYEFRHKENGWRDHFNLYWKTPFHEQKTWKQVPAFYLFDYDCELSCIAQGTPCDDGNAFTNNDQFDANCNCAGTPCNGPDCDDSMAKYSFYEECASTNNLVTDPAYSWYTCAGGQPNPNAARSANTRWIKYDFGYQYKFQGSRIWNYNVLNDTDKGFKNVVVDYSVDGNSWQPLGGTYSWPQAPGNSDYGGFPGPNFNDIKARYVLISSIDNWGDASCSGFSKITFDAIHCDNDGTPCDDKDPLTTYDKFDNNCNCKGIDINCANDTLNLSYPSLADGAFKAKKQITAQSLVPGSNNISFTAGNSIVLLPGFKADNTAVFSAKIEDCLQTAFVNNEINSLNSIGSENKTILNDDPENDKIKKIIFRLNEPGNVTLKLLDSKGKNIVTIIDQYYESLGTQIKLLPIQKLSKGTYWIELNINGNTVKEKLEING